MIPMAKTSPFHKTSQEGSANIIRSKGCTKLATRQALYSKLELSGYDTGKTFSIQGCTTN